MGFAPPALGKESTRPRSGTSFPCKPRLVLPLEGKGDRFAVDEVKMRTAPLPRSVSKSFRWAFAYANAHPY